MKHIVIPDVQAKPGVPLEHLEWIGKYILYKRPDVIVCIGDFADMESLCSYDKGKKSFEGRRYKADIDTTKEAMDILLKPIREYNAQQKSNKKSQYKPRMVMTLGNHEERIMRACNDNPEMDGLMGYHQLPYEDWEVFDYLKPIEIDGVMYVHYLSNPMSGKPYGGTALSQLTKVGQSFVVGHKQTLDVATRFTVSGKQQWGIIAGACLTPDHKVLTADLQYVELGSVKVGDQLLSFDEENPGVKRSRRYKKGAVNKVKRAIKPVFKVTLDSGKEFKVTADHRWLVKLNGAYYWRTTDSLRKGTCIPKLLDEWETLNSYDAGWLSGMYDGEGCLYQRETSGGSSIQLSVCQKEGNTLDRLKECLYNLIGEDNTTHTRAKDNCMTLRVKGGMAAILKLLGSVRPKRLLEKFDPDNIGGICRSDYENDKVVSIEALGEQEIVMIDIDTKTMIVEGYGHHNCYLHDEGYKGYQGNHHWRGLIVLNDVVNGSFSPFFVSLDYLKERYGK